MTRRKIMIGAIIGSATLSVAALAGIARYYAVRDDDDEGDRGAVARALRFAKVTLQQGLTASELEGQPISAKFEVDRGKFQLAVHTSKDGRFSEVLVNYSTGEIMKVQPITQGNDLDIAREQSEAMAKAKMALREAVDKALVEVAGFRAVAVVPNLKDGRAVASVLLFKGDESKIVNQRLD
jgi:hypothetical protein